MEKDKRNKKKRVICLVVLDILSVFCIVLIYNYTKNADYDSLSSIVELDDGRTTIYTMSLLPNKISFYLYILVFIAINLILITVIKIVEYFRKNKLKLIVGIIIIISFNMLMTLLLFPKGMLYSTIINLIAIIMVTIKYLLDKK